MHEETGSTPKGLYTVSVREYAFGPFRAGCFLVDLFPWVSPTATDIAPLRGKLGLFSSPLGR